MKRLIGLWIACCVAAAIAGCSSSETEQKTVTSTVTAATTAAAANGSLCDQFCTKLDLLKNQQCDINDAGNCASILTDKVLLAGEIQQAGGPSAQTQAIADTGELYGKANCRNLSGDVQCWQWAQQISTEFSGLATEIRYGN